jgi:hypothetical protein
MTPSGRFAGSSRPPGHPELLPLRPLTAGELLDSAVGLLRVRTLPLLGFGALLATAEQALLYPLRRLADVDVGYWPADDRWAQWTLLVAVGFAGEAFAVAVLGRPAAGAALRAMLGRDADRREPARRPVIAALVAGLAVALVCGAAVLTAFGWPPTFWLLAPVTVLLWIAGYGLLGLAVPAVVVDRLGPLRALWRSVRLSARGGMRTLRIRVMAYLSWFAIRLAWGAGVMSLVALVYSSPDTRTDVLLMAPVYLLVNAVAYPLLACLDAVLHVEARMRTEGLDIALRRAAHRGVDPVPALVRAEL